MSTRSGESGSGGHMWTGEGAQDTCGRPHRKLKLESTDTKITSSIPQILAYLEIAQENDYMKKFQFSGQDMIVQI